MSVLSRVRDFMIGPPLTYSTIATDLAAIKSMRDMTTTGDFGTGVVTVYQGTTLDVSRFFRKQNVRRLRDYSQFSPWIRAAIKIYRDVVEQAEWQLVPIDKDKPVNIRAKAQIEALLKGRYGRYTYAELKGMMVEDYLVLGHGAIELTPLTRGLQPLGFGKIDAAALALLLDWDGSIDKPAYALLNQTGNIARTLNDKQLIFFICSPTSYDNLGIGYVETLDKTIGALLAGDDYLVNQVMNPSPGGMLNLGLGAKATQVEDVRRQLDTLRKAYAVIGGTDKASYTPFNTVEQAMNVLSSEEWFVRQVAANFDISTARLKLAVDTSRANTGEMMDNDLEGVGVVLNRIQGLENATIVASFGETNLQLVYALLNKRDEKRQTDIAAKQVANQPIATLNEGRAMLGLEPLADPMADELLITDGTNGVVPLSALAGKLATLYQPPPVPQLPAAGDPVALPAPKNEKDTVPA